MATLHELHYWHHNSYGQALRIHKKTLHAAAITVCIITPFTNWLIPLIHKLIKNDFVLRYEQTRSNK